MHFMKKLIVTLLTIFTLQGAFAGHIAGGELYYRYLGPGVAPNTDRFEITLRLFRECDAGPNFAPLPSLVTLGIYRTANGTLVRSVDVGRVGAPAIEEVQMSPNPCVIPQITICYQVGYFTTIQELPRDLDGYIISFQTCCRTQNIANIQTFFIPGGVGNGEGATYMGKIPGTDILNGGANSSPVFALKDTTMVCRDNPFTLDFSATDSDGDSLSYEFCSAFDRGAATSSQLITPSNPSPFPPHYNPVTYTPGFSGTSPLGPGVTINPRTGIISGIAPDAGRYVVNVCIKEWRNGINISVHRKDFTLRVGSCDFAKATLNPTYTTCDGYTLNFTNLSSNPLNQTYYWDFGVPNITTDTSTLQSPTYTFPDTGIYLIKLVVNRGLSCPDSTIAVARVFPGFRPGFRVVGNCVNVPFQFIDTTSTDFGFVDTWRWDFGETTATNDTSRLRNPTYLYPAPGPKRVEFIVTNSKGCIDTVYKDITVRDKPDLSVPFKDTTICKVDNLQLDAIGTGIFSWTPVVNISNPNVQNPVVNPQQTTSYIVTLNDNGCLARDTIKINVKDSVTIFAGRDTTICLGDTVQLFASGDALGYNWDNGVTLNDPTAQNPFAVPTQPLTVYTVTGRISAACTNSRQVTIRTVPYPQADAGQDPEICFRGTAQLNATIVGNNFSWSPTNYLSNPNILNPTATPPGTIRYILRVTDNIGCPKPKFDTVVVTVLPKIFPFAGNDTTVVINQPLQFNATGGTSYVWSPPTFLSNPNVGNPVGVYNGVVDSIRYKVYVSNTLGCSDSDEVLVRIFKTIPDIFVPTGFTPNGDGKNDVFRPLLAGIKKLEYFRVYNRWGQLVFTTSEQNKGWNGMVGGKPQDSGTFVWMVSGTDYLDRPIRKKGSVVLVR
jgi:gliding motility-associated-like protein